MSSELLEFEKFKKIALNLYDKNQRDELENIRKEALSSQEALKYYFLTDLLGLVPEDKYLFKRGNSFLLGLKELEKELIIKKSNVEKQKIIDFLAEAQNLLSKNISHPPYYRGILIKYFPKFGDFGNQPVNKMDDLSVKQLFVKVYEHYKNKQK